MRRYSVHNPYTKWAATPCCRAHAGESRPQVPTSTFAPATEWPVASISIIDGRKVLRATLNNGTCQLRESPFRHAEALLGVGRGESPTSLLHYSSRNRTYPPSPQPTFTSLPHSLSHPLRAEPLGPLLTFYKGPPISHPYITYTAVSTPRAVYWKMLVWKAIVLSALNLMLLPIHFTLPDILQGESFILISLRHLLSL